MIKQSLFIALICAVSSVNAQTLSAGVVDNSDRPIEGVKVFYSNTTLVDFTNSSGVFTIDKTKTVPNPILVFYHPQYETLIETETTHLLPKYRLNKRPDNLKVTNYSLSPFSKDEMFSAFKKLLIGKGKNARNSSIINKEDIVLQFRENNNTLVAKAYQPIYIINQGLGYQIEYHLDYFEVEFSAKTLDELYIDMLFFAGHSHFKDIDASKTKQRDKIYEESLPYFFKNVLNENYKALNYKVVVNGKKIKPNQLFKVEKNEDNSYKITFDDSMIRGQDDEYFLTTIEFYSKHQAKTIEFYKPFILLDKFGNFLNIDDIQVTDDVSSKGMADEIPINYHSFKTN